MKFIFKSLLYTLFLLFTVVIFLPKSNIFYFLERQLQLKSIIVTDENINSGLFDFNMNESTIIYEKNKFAKVENMQLKTYVFYNTLELKNIEILDKFTKQYPIKTKELTINYSVLNPLSIDIKAVGDFGSVTGKVDLVKQKINYVLKASKNMKKNYRKILRKMKQKKGEYIYEQQL